MALIKGGYPLEQAKKFSFGQSIACFRGNCSRQFDLEDEAYDILWRL